MLRNLLLGTAAIALAFAATPACAQLVPGDVEIEGPMSAIEIYPAGDPRITDVTSQGNRTSVGQIKVLNVVVKVLQGALIHTPTNGDLGLQAGVSNTARGLQRLAGSVGGFLPGRSGAANRGFLGGTAIVVGSSDGGQVYANDVFSDLFEHVIVGEATAPMADDDGTTLRATVNKMRILPIDDGRMPAGPAINGLGLEIDSTKITAGTLVAAEGYLAGNNLYYHTLEADDAPLARPDDPQVGILRADCRIRGGGRDEIEVRGGVANPANATVSISIPSVARPNRFTAIGVVTATPDPVASSPNQGIFRANFRTLNITDGVCPTRVRATLGGSNPAVFVTADMEGR